jgi:hypothetical protein
MGQVEGWEASIILKELTLAKMLRQDGVRCVLFDADDTLWPTIWLFRQFMAECWDYCGGLPSVRKNGGLEAVRKEIVRVNDEVLRPME